MTPETYEALYVALVTRLNQIVKFPSNRQIANELVRIVPGHVDIVKREKDKKKERKSR